jgi:hypothetical protein
MFLAVFKKFRLVCRLIFKFNLAEAQTTFRFFGKNSLDTFGCVHANSARGNFNFHQKWFRLNKNEKILYKKTLFWS